MAKNPLKELERFGQSPWFDNISRRLLESGELRRMVEEDGLKGVTSNPTIFEKAIAGTSDYDEALARAAADGTSDPKALYEALALQDIRAAATQLLPVYQRTDGADGYVSLEVSPNLAYDTAGTIEEAERLFTAAGCRNVMIKVPATREGLPAIAHLIGRGINVNVTLIFSVERYREVLQAYLEGLERLRLAGKPLSSVASVASFFVSRIDTAVDLQVGKESPLAGKAAIANAKAAYQAFQEFFASARFKALLPDGARVQRPLWASTGTKNPAYPDTLYVDELIGRDTVNTIPEATWAAFRDHGRPRASLEKGLSESRAVLEDLRKAGVDLAAITERLEREGVQAFVKSFESLLASVAEKAARLEKKSPRESDFLTARLWAKDASLWKEDPAHQAVIGNSLGWLDLPSVMPGRVEELESFSAEVRKAGLRHAVVLGMGGSSLAPEVFRRVFPARKGSLALHVLDSTDPEAVAACEKAAPPRETLYIVASKSGTTVEPQRMLDYFRAVLERAEGARAGSHFVAVTDPGSELARQAQDLGFRRAFMNFADVGGRYSALSYFGLVPAALLGMDLKALLERAARMAEACRPGSLDNPGRALGEALAEHAAEGRDKLTFLASPPIESLGLWLEQLVAESTGKEGRGIVPIAGEPLKPAEAYGPDRVFAYLRLEGADNAPLDALAGALKRQGRPVLTLPLSDALDLGAEFFRWEVGTAVAGARMGINPFDQPDVQSAKDQAKALMAALKSDGRLPAPRVHAASDGISLTLSQAALGCLQAGASPRETLARLLGTAKPADYAALLAFLSPDGRYDLPLAEARRALADASGLPVQWGYGPRYLHSTGQLHKGGAGNGLFVILAREGGPDLAIPGAGHSFGQLIGAQALGDFQALDAAGRRAVFLRLSEDPRKSIPALTEWLRGVARTAVKA